MRDPELKAPWAISLAMAFTYGAGFLLNIVLCFVMGDPAKILASPIAQPVAQIFYNVLGKAGGIFYTVCAVIIRKRTTKLSYPVTQLTEDQSSLSASLEW
jgi:amino acid transporter